jgi:hypothetical protein
MNARPLAVLAAAAALTASFSAAAPAGAAPKTMKATYSVTEPVPYPSQTGGCNEGVEDVNKDSHAITLPNKGVLVVKMTFTGDWDLYLQNAAGDVVASSEGDNTGNTDGATEKLTYKKGTKGQKLTIVACNWAGLTDATVSYVHTY